MKKIINFVLLLIIVFVSITPAVTKADSVTDNALNFLKSKQDSTGKITTGFSAPSEWSAIAFTINGIDVSTVSNSGQSLKDYLLTDTPVEPSSATDWENRILAIVAIGDDPTNFGGVNYIQKLETFYNNHQIGDICSVNDDVFGLLALIAAGNTSTMQIKQDTLNFLLQKQDPNGGFGFSAPGCSSYSTSSDMTGAAIQALEEAKGNGFTNFGLDNAIAKAENYLLTNQDSDGGFGYSGSSDSDSTGWVLMAFNVLGLKDSAQAVKAKNWLLTQQSSIDGGFQDFDYSSNSLISNSTTTAQSIIALFGDGWIIKIFNPESLTPSPIITLINTPPLTLTPTLTVVPSDTPTPTSIPTPSPTITPTPSLTPVPTIFLTPTPVIEIIIVTSTPTLIPSPEVLGESTVSGDLESTPTPKPEIEQSKILFTGLKTIVLLIVGVAGLFILFKFLEGGKGKI